MSPGEAAPPALPPVLVRGRGLAAACAAHLLRRDGIAVHAEAGSRSPVPVIMLSDAALALLRDVFGQPDLFAAHHRITRRAVRWGGQATEMPHGGVVVSELDLLQALEGAANPAEAAADPAFTIHAAPPLPSGDLLHFGQRRAAAVPVVLAETADRACCHVEAVERGWLFLIPSGPATAWLLAVGGPVERLLEESRLVAPLVAALGEVSSGFETAPRQLPSLAGPGWLACGMSAIAFDPICGDGTAQAVREAILAAAVIRAGRDGADSEKLATHYHSMLTASLRRHIQISGQFYATGGDGPWWRAQVAALREGYAWGTSQLARLPEPRYVLQGYRLLEKEAAT